jgi:hypothetical protein
MLRRMIVAVGLIAATASAAAAIERATFVMTDGSRQSGLVVFHGSENNNIIDNHANLGDGQQERTFPVDQIAIIDFAGGDPSTAEFQRLPESGNLLVLRSGASQGGKLLNLVGGETVRWQNESGQTQQYAIRDVARIYLNPDAARRAYPQVAAAAAAANNAQQAQAAPAAAAPADQAVPRNAVRVPANTAWTPTGVRVLRGQRIVFNVTGQVQVSPNPEQVAGPDGNAQIASPNLPAGMPVGGLIGRIGNGQPFVIGGSGQPITMPATGQLMLGVNDTNMGDNSGAFVVTLSSPLR